MKDSTQKETALSIANQELMTALNELQNHCAALEAKMNRVKKIRALFHAAAHVECKGCGSTFASNVFAAHVKLCQQLLKAEGHMQFLMRRRSTRASCSSSPMKVKRLAKRLIV